MKKITAFLLATLIVGSIFVVPYSINNTKADEPGESFFYYPEKKPYGVFVAPQIDWSKFWDIFKKHTLWSLEGSLDGEIWYEEIPGSDINLTTDVLNLGAESTGENSRKITLDFTAIDPPGPSTSAYYRFSFAIDYRVKTYVNRTDIHQYTISYEVHNETFNLTFDWSDYVNSSLANHSHVKRGITKIGGRDYFYFRVISDNPIEAGTYIELDPTYTVFSGGSISLSTSAQRKLVRQSNGTLWCTFYETYDVHIAWSEDDGVTWTDYEVWGAESSWYPSIAVDSNDVVHLVFQSFKSDGNDYQLEYTSSTDWATFVQIRDEDKRHEHPALAIDSNDVLHVVYEKGEEGTSGDDQLAYINSTDNGVSWGTEQIITDEVDLNDDEWYPSIAIDNNDILHVVYYIEDGSAADKDIVAHMESSTCGDTWSAWDGDVVLSTGNDVRNPCIVITDDNDIMVTGYEFLQDVFYRYNGSSDSEWSNGTSTLEIYGNGQFSSISVSNGSAYIVFQEEDLEDIQYYYNYSSSWNDGGIILVGTYEQLNLISTQHPTISGVKTNRPRAGYAFIATGNNFANITYYASDDLAWENILPSFTNMSVSPSTGEEGDITFYFNVSIRDPDDAVLDSINCRIWLGAWVDNATMTHVTGNNLTGADYTYNRTFPSPGTYYYKFLAYDGSDWNSSATYSLNVGQNTTFQITFPVYLDVGDYILSSGTIKYQNGTPIDEIWVYTKILNDTDATVLLSDVSLYVRYGVYQYIFSTSRMIAGIYTIQCNFTHTGLNYATNWTLYLSNSSGPGYYATTIHFNFYHSTEYVGLLPNLFKIYVSEETTIESTDRIYSNLYNTYTQNTFYYRIDDYFDNKVFPTDADYQSHTVTTINEGIDVPITWYELTVKNLNETIMYFTMENSSRYYNITLFPMDTERINVLPGSYNITMYFYSAITSSLLSTRADIINMTDNGFYVATGYSAMVHISWYNTNEGLGLPDETLKIYIDGYRQASMSYYTYINKTINLTIKDYYNFTLYQGNHTVNSTQLFIDRGLTFHSWLFGNKNEEYYFLSFLKEGATRWYEKGIMPYGDREFLLPSGNYTMRIYDADYTDLHNDSYVVNRSMIYLIEGTNLSAIIAGQSVIIGEILELKQEEYPAAPPSDVEPNQPGIPSPEPPEYPDDPFTASDTYNVLRMTQMPESNAEVTVVFIDSGYTSRIYDGVELTSIIGYKHPTLDTPYDDLGHGTFVSYAFAKIFQTHLPNARLISFKVFGKDGQCTQSQLLDVFDAIKKLKPDVVSFSGGAYGTRFDKVSKKVEELRNDGIVVVVAAGNLGPAKGTILSPGVSEASICIGAIDPMGTILDRRDDIVTIWSSRGPVPFVDHKPDFTGPGESILGPWMHSEVIISGTSMSTPFIAAGMAIMYANNKPILDFVDMLYFWDGQTVPNILEDALKDSAFRKTPIDSYGWGIPDFEKANDAIFLKAIFSILLFIGLIATTIIGSFLIWRYYLKDKNFKNIPK